ncbi:MAG: hypothetical protein IPK22_11490 [Verrucomicrobiaceae bacterium]|nr:hypothetical protein [Verrucomicrobiaceae bacterium]
MPRKSTKIPAVPTPADYAAARHALGHSQVSLAEAIGMSLRTIKHHQRIRQGQRHAGK